MSHLNLPRHSAAGRSRHLLPVLGGLLLALALTAGFLLGRGVRPGALPQAAPVSAQASAPTTARLSASALRVSHGTEPAPVSAPRQNEEITWRFDEASRTLTISGRGLMDDYPDGDYTPWEDVRGDVRRIVVEEGVVSIGSCAFAGFGSLEELVLPGSLRVIGEAAFSWCYSLHEVRIPVGVRSIRDAAFGACLGLEKAELPEGLTYLGKAFGMCEKLTEVHLPASLRFLDTYAFTWCSRLETVYYAGSREQWSSIIRFTEDETYDEDFEDPLLSARLICAG